MINLYFHDENGQREFRGSYPNLKEAIRSIVRRCKLRDGYQNSFIETDDLISLAEIAGVEAGDLYRYKDGGDWDTICKQARGEP